MRILKNGVVVYGYDELTPQAKLKAQLYIIKRKNENGAIGKNYYFGVNDFEWFATGLVMFYTHNINAY